MDDDIYRSSVLTLGEKWRAEIEEHDEIETNKSSPDDAPLNFDIQYIHENLKELELDRHGHIKLNGITRGRLEEALGPSQLALTEYDLQVLRESIHNSLPDEIGREASELLLNYFHYLRAKEQLLKSEHMLVQPEDMKAHLASLSDLRVALLGAATAKRLFGKLESDRTFMLESMALDRNGDLSPEERMARIEKLAEKYHQYAPPIDDWNSRSHRFVERLRASDMPTEQLEQNAYHLLTEEFSETEIDLMREYRIDLFDQLGERTSASMMTPVSMSTFSK
jgi:hypothetical protein